MRIFSQAIHQSVWKCSWNIFQLPRSWLAAHLLDIIAKSNPWMDSPPPVEFHVGGSIHWWEQSAQGTQMQHPMQSLVYFWRLTCSLYLTKKFPNNKNGPKYETEAAWTTLHKLVQALVSPPTAEVEGWTWKLKDWDVRRRHMAKRKVSWRSQGKCSAPRHSIPWQKQPNSVACWAHVTQRLLQYGVLLQCDPPQTAWCLGQCPFEWKKFESSLMIYNMSCVFSNQQGRHQNWVLKKCRKSRMIATSYLKNLSRTWQSLFATRQRCLTSNASNTLPKNGQRAAESHHETNVFQSLQGICYGSWNWICHLCKKRKLCPHRHVSQQQYKTSHIQHRGRQN